MQQQHISNGNERVSQAEYARRRGLNRSTISRQVRQGKIPIGSDGLLNPEEADKARECNLHSLRGRSALKQQQRKPPPLIFEGDPVEIDQGARRVFETLIAGSIRIPDILAGLGVRDPVVLAISSEVFTTLIFTLAAVPSDVAYDWLHNDDCSPTPDVDMKALAAKFGFQLDAEAVRTDYTHGRPASAAERVLDKLDALIWEWDKAHQ